MKIFSIYGGRTSFWQWDLGQRLIVSDETCSEVHFDNGTTEKALINKVYEVDGIRLVDVPSIFLQSDRLLKVFAFVKDETGQYTEHSDIFSVVQRSKPEDYTYPEAGGYYIPVASQISNDVLQIAFKASEFGMEAVAPVDVILPAGPQGEQGIQGEKGDKGDTGAQGPQGEKGEAPDAVLYTEQSLAPEQQAQARENIGAADDAEVQGIRTGADGVNYANAGEAVRTQLGKLFSQSDIVHLNLVQGYYVYPDDVPTWKSSTKRISTPAGEYIVPERAITVSVAAGYQYFILQCNPETHLLVKAYGWLTAETECPSGYAYIFTLAKADNSVISESEGGNILCILDSELGIRVCETESGIVELNRRADKLNRYIGTAWLNMKNGVYVASNGVFTYKYSASRLATPEDEYCVFQRNIKVSVETGYQYVVLQYDAETHELVKNYAWTTEEAEFPAGYAYKFTLAKVDNTAITEDEKGNINCVLVSGMVDDIREIKKQIVSSYEEEQKALVRKVLDDKDSNTVTAVVLTDTHYDDTSDTKKRTVEHLDILSSIALKTGASFVAHLGDVINELHTKEDNLRLLADYWSAQNNTPVPVLYTMAHHEQYGTQGASGWGNDATACTREECLGMYGQTSKYLGMVWSADYSCWYVDIKGTRFIGLDITDGSAGIFSEAAKVFLTDAINGAEKAVVLSHIPPRAGVNCYNGSTTGGAAVETLLNNSGKVIAYIHGHTHWDNLFKPTDGTFPYISVCCALPIKVSEATYCSEGTPTAYDRVIGEYSEYCFDVFNIHTDTGEVNAFRFGAGADRAYTPE